MIITMCIYIVSSQKHLKACFADSAALFIYKSQKTAALLLHMKNYV